jgi:hypothetical protein
VKLHIWDTSGQGRFCTIIRYRRESERPTGQVVVVLCRVADPDPESIGSVDPDSESGSGSRRAKITHKSRKKFINFMF